MRELVVKEKIRFRLHFYSRIIFVLALFFCHSIIFFLPPRKCKHKYIFPIFSSFTKKLNKWSKDVEWTECLPRWKCVRTMTKIKLHKTFHFCWLCFRLNSLSCYQMMTRYVIVINWSALRPLVVGLVVPISEYFGPRIIKFYWSSARNVQVRQTIQIKLPRSVKLMFLVW